MNIKNKLILKNKKMEQKKISIIFISVIAFIIITVFIFLFFKKNKIETENSSVVPVVEFPAKTNETKMNDNVVVEGGYLIKLNEKTIDFSNFENSESKGTKEEREKGMKSLNVSLTNPTTPVYKTINGEKKEAKLSDLRSGQLVFVEYDKATKNLISINISEE